MKKAKRLAIIVCAIAMLMSILAIPASAATQDHSVSKNYKNFWAQYNSWTQKIYYIYNKTWYLQNEK